MKLKTKILATVLAATTAFGTVGILGACDNGGETVITVTGSSSVSPVMQKLAAAYEQDNKNVSIRITTSDSSQGVTDTQQGRNDIGMVSRAVKSTETGVYSTTICNDGIAIIVNKSCAIDDITNEQLFNLYISNTAVGGITHAISREDGSGTRSAFDSLVKNDAGTKIESVEGGLHKNTLIQNNTGLVKTAIASSNGDMLGYISMGSLDDTVKALKFNGIAATVENVKALTYELSRPFNIVTSSQVDSLTGAVKGFVDFILSEEGQAVITQEGYIAL